MKNGLVSPAEEGTRKVDHFLRFYRTSYLTNSTVSSNGASISSCVMRTTATFTSAAEERGSE